MHSATVALFRTNILYTCRRSAWSTLAQQHSATVALSDRTNILYTCRLEALKARLLHRAQRHGGIIPN